MNPVTSVTSPKLALHHVGLLVRDLERATRHYTETLGYQVDSAAIDDATQTARVLFLRLPGADHWLELVTPLGSQSKLSNALAKGGGIHHVCYEVCDIASALLHFRAAGCLVVSEPAPASAFPGRHIAWVMDRERFLFELLEAGPGHLSLSNLRG